MEILVRPTAAFVVILLPIVQKFGLGGLLISGVLAHLVGLREQPKDLILKSISKLSSSDVFLCESIEEALAFADGANKSN